MEEAILLRSYHVYNEVYNMAVTMWRFFQNYCFVIHAKYGAAHGLMNIWQAWTNSFWFG